MTRRERPLLADLTHEIGSLKADLGQMVTLRRQLASLEVRAAVGQIKRLSIAWLVFAVMLLSALPILAVAAAWWLGERDAGGIAFAPWLLIFGLGLSISAVAGGLLAWRRFRRRFVGIEQTLEELHEDGLWLRQWLGSRKDSQQ